MVGIPFVGMRSGRNGFRAKAYESSFLVTKQTIVTQTVVVLDLMEIILRYFHLYVSQIGEVSDMH